MTHRSRPDPDEVLRRVRDLLLAERRRLASPRGTPEYAVAEADEERKRRLVWDLVDPTNGGPDRLVGGDPP